MNKIIDKEYVKDEYVQLMMMFGMFNNVLVASPKEIIFLIINGEVIINKYLDHNMRYNFPKSEKSSHIDPQHNSRFYNMIFKTNTSYIMCYSNKNSRIYSCNIFSKLDNGDALWNETNFDFKSDSLEQGILSEKNLEDFILSYDEAIHIIDFKGNIIYSSTTEDGLVRTPKSKKVSFPLVAILAKDNTFEAFLIGKMLNKYFIKNLELPNTFAQNITSALEGLDEANRVKHPSI